MKEDILVSVVVPFYNTPMKYFEKCIESILDQDYKNIEVVVINDGSTKDATEKLNEFCKRDKRIQVYTQENQGEGAARNSGISQSSGKYIIFVDSDDQLSQGWINYSLQLAIQNDADIVAGRVVQISSTDQPAIDKVCNEYAVIEKRDYWKIQRDFLYFKTDIVKNMPVLDPGVCSKLIKRDCISYLRFPIGIKLSSDQVFNHEMLHQSKVFVLTNRVSYFYIANDQSISHVYQPLAAEYMMKSMDLVKKHLVNRNEVLQAFYYRVLAEILEAIQYALFSERNKLSIKEKVDGINQDCNMPLVREMLDNLDISTLPSNSWKFKYKLLKNRKYKLFVILKELSDRKG